MLENGASITRSSAPTVVASLPDHYSLHDVEVAAAPPPPVGVNTVAAGSLTNRVSRKNLKQNGPQKKCSVGFENIRFTVADKVILQNATGIVRPGELLTILGPSGSGKTTLLSILAKRTSEYGRTAKLQGDVLFDGQPASTRDRRDLVSLIPQEQALFGDFTVEETMWFQARLYFGWRGFTRQEIDEQITRLLTSLGIHGCRNVKVGSLLFKGLSGGQKRRLAIAVEILSSPSIILLDECTTGLDSATALGIFQELVRLANCGHAVVATIHQPSSQMWNAMTNIMIMSQGYVVYSGPATGAATHFASFSLVCPKRFNPSEFYLGVVTSDFDVPAFKHNITVPELAEKFMQTEIFTQGTLRVLAQIKDVQSSTSSSPRRKSSFIAPRRMKQVSIFSQFCTLTWRNFANYRANLAILLFRWASFVVLAIMFGLVFLNAGDIAGDRGVMATVSALLSTCAFFSFMSIAVIPFIIEDRLVFQRELRNGAYRKTPLVLSLIAVSIVATALIAITASIITVYMCQVSVNVGLHFLALWCVLLYAELFVLSLGAFFRYYIVGIALAASWYSMMLITAGTFVQTTSISWIARWLSLINPLFWVAKAVFAVEFYPDREIGGKLYPDSFAVYDFFETNLYGVEGYWPNLGVAASLLVILMIIFWLIIETKW